MLLNQHGVIGKQASGQSGSLQSFPQTRQHTLEKSESTGVKCKYLPCRELQWCRWEGAKQISAFLALLSPALRLCSCVESCKEQRGCAPVALRRCCTLMNGSRGAWLINSRSRVCLTKQGRDVNKGTMTKLKIVLVSALMAHRKTPHKVVLWTSN